ncbi:unnamed protein product, partial [Closterium sp. NIES-54]
MCVCVPMYLTTPHRTSLLLLLITPYHTALHRYEVRAKGRRCMDDIDSFIRSSGFFRESGIVYCLSRNDCEKTAEQLTKLGHRAGFYHANIAAGERADVQRRWSKDEINVICATVAFGMGGCG